MMNKIIGFIGLVLFTFFALATWLGWITFRLPENKSKHALINQSAVLSKIHELNYLESTAFYIDSIIRTEKQGNWFALWQDSQKGIFIAKGSAVAGLDLNKIHTQDVTVRDDEIIIRLPPVEVLSVQLNHLEVFDLRTGVLNLYQADFSVLDAVQQQAKQQILRQSCQNGLLEHAKERSQQQLQQLFALSNMKVSFFPSDAPTKCVMPKNAR